MALNGFSAVLFVPLATEVLAKIKRTTYTSFYPLILRVSFHTVPLKIKFTMT